MGRNKANKIGYKFVPFPVDVLRSKAWEKLTNTAKVAYLPYTRAVVLQHGEASVGVLQGDGAFHGKENLLGSIETIKGHWLHRKDPDGRPFP